MCTNAWAHGRMWHGMFGERQKAQSGEKGGRIDWGKKIRVQLLSVSLAFEKIATHFLSRTCSDRCDQPKFFLNNDH